MTWVDERNVYFAKPVGFDGPIKIGFSRFPAKRMSELSVWLPFPLELIGSVPGGSEHEHWLHRKLWEYRVHGEWFAAVPPVLDVISDILARGSIHGPADAWSPRWYEKAQTTEAT